MSSATSRLAIATPPGPPRKGRPRRQAVSPQAEPLDPGSRPPARAVSQAVEPRRELVLPGDHHLGRR